MSGVRRRLTRQGFPPEIASVIEKCRRPSTLKQYKPYIELWEQFCIENNYDSVNTTVLKCLSFLQTLNIKNYSYSALNTAKSALTCCINLKEGKTLGEHRDVQNYMRGIFNSRPPTRKKTKIWDPSLVIIWLKNQPNVNICSISELAGRLAILILLTTGQRPQVLVALRITRMTRVGQSFTFSLDPLDVKQGRPGYRTPDVILTSFEDERICVTKHLEAYLQRTESSRKGIDNLFITSTKPYHAATGNTVSRWIKNILLKAGISVELASAGSARSASTSKAAAGGAPLDTIMSSAGWAKESTFQRFYNKPLLTEKNLSNFILN